MVQASLPLNSNDRLYAEIRGMNISNVAPMLLSRVRDLQAKESVRRWRSECRGSLWPQRADSVVCRAVLQNRHTLSKVTDIKNFVKQMPGMQEDKKSLTKFINVTELVQKVTSTEAFHEQWQIERGRCCCCCCSLTVVLVRTHGVLTHFRANRAAILEKERAKDVQDYLEACIGRREPMAKVLKLMSLLCISEDGFQQKTFDQYRRDILQVRQSEARQLRVCASVGARSTSTRRGVLSARRRTDSSTCSRCATWKRWGC
jgi:hypothetical protein